MKQSNIKNVMEGVINTEEYVADLEQALTIAGFGWYNFKYCLVQALFLISAIIEIMGYAYVLPAAKCDLNITDSQRGLISSLPYVAIIITSFGWGYVVDTMGRKRAVVYSSLVSGVLGIIAAFMPNLISFTIFKFLASLCVACPASTPYTIIGEIVPVKYRDLMLSVTNAKQLLGVTLVPLLAWGILSFNFSIDFGTYYFRPWRLLSIIFSVTFLISAILMFFGPESPKYLMSKGKHEEALEVLQRIYAGNTKKSCADYPIKKLKVYGDINNEKVSFFTSLKMQSLPLFKPPYLKWLALEGFLLFGLFSVLNGLFMWVPDVLNRVFSGNSSGLTACEVIALRLNETEEASECDDNLDRMTFVISAVGSSCTVVLALILSSSLKFIGKKTLTIVMFFITGVFCLLSIFVTEQIIFAILLSSLQLSIVCIGPVNAFAIEIFPTKLRGMAVSLAIMIGRFGSVTSTNVTGLLINNSCTTTFYMFGGLLILCGLLTFLLPSSKVSRMSKKVNRVSISKILEVGDESTDDRKQRNGDKNLVQLKAYRLNEDFF